MFELTLNHLFEDWKANASHINRRTGEIRKPENVKLDVDRMLIHVLPILGHRPITDIKRKDINALRDAVTFGATRTKKKTKPRGVRRATGGSGTATRTVGTLSSVLSYAVDIELLEHNPCRGVKLTPGKKNERYLSEAEASRLGEVLNRWDHGESAKTAVAIIRLLSLTGARRGEITNLMWSEVDLDQGFLRLGTSKTGYSVRPISKLAIDLIAAQPKTQLCKLWCRQGVITSYYWRAFGP